MKLEHCELTASAIQASRDGNWSEEWSAHAASCESCRMARWMGKMSAAIEARAGALPEAELIWLKARIRERSKQPKRALLTIRAALWFGAAGLGALLSVWPYPDSMGEWSSLAISLAPNLTETLTPVLSQPQAALWLIPAGILTLLALGLTASEA